MAEVLNSSLEHLHQLTICARFKTLNFQVNPGVSNYQAIIVLGPFWLLGSYTALPCEDRYTGCTDSERNTNPLWRYGMANGYHYSEDSNHFKAWHHQVWNSVCISAEQNNLNITINEEMVFNQTDYKENHRKVNGTNLVLMNDREERPMQGMVTDLHVWKKVLTRTEISDWSSCRSSELGDVVSWNSAELNITDLNSEEMDRATICPTNKSLEETFIAFDMRQTFDETVRFCKDLGGEIAVSVDQETLAIMTEVHNATCSDGQGYFYGGYSDQEEEGHWVSAVTGTAVNWDDWDEKQPTNYTNYDCVEISSGYDKLLAFHCSVPYCPICQVWEMKTFQLRGVCLESQVDKYFLMVNSTYFSGYTRSDLVFSTTSQRWQIILKNNQTLVLAYLKAEDSLFPLGLQPWYFENKSCQDSGEEFRSLNLHLSVDQPGSFCCEDGHCIDAQLVCNNFNDCHDLSDEKNCSLVVIPSTYGKEFPSLQLNEGEKRPLALEAKLTILNIFNIDDVDSTFDLHFLLTVEWFDKDLTYQFLKNSSFENVLSSKYFEQIWKPEIGFDQKVKVINSFENIIFVTKMGEPTLNGEVDVINLRELYKGTENPLTILINKRILFSCSFDNINNYPFGRQSCHWDFFLLGADNKLTKIIPKQLQVSKGRKGSCDVEILQDLGPVSLGQYIVESWDMKETHKQATDLNTINVKMVLKRRFFSIFMVSYLPTVIKIYFNDLFFITLRF